MGHKNLFPNTLNWQSTNPATGFFPNPNQNSGGSTPSGITSGAMASTNTIYSNIIDLSRYDNIGFEVNFTGTPTGTISVLCSNGGNNFYALTFNPAISQPAGSAGGFLIDINQLPFRYMMIQYTNSSGSGTLTVLQFSRDLN